MVFDHTLFIYTQFVKRTGKFDFSLVPTHELHQQFDYPFGVPGKGFR